LVAAGNLDELLNNHRFGFGYGIESDPTLGSDPAAWVEACAHPITFVDTSDHTRLYGNRMPQLAASTKSVAPLREIPMAMQGSTTCDPIYFLFTGLIVGVRFRPRSIARPARSRTATRRYVLIPD
jgi:hypothetical protein